jgi:hypothetical protein
MTVDVYWEHELPAIGTYIRARDQHGERMALVLLVSRTASTERAGLPCGTPIVTVRHGNGVRRLERDALGWFVDVSPRGSR